MYEILELSKLKRQSFEDILNSSDIEDTYILQSIHERTEFEKKFQKLKIKSKGK